MIVTHKPIPLYMQVAEKYTFLWTKRGLQLARPGDWIVTAPTGCTWRIRKKRHKFYVQSHRTQYRLKAIQHE